MTRLRFPRWSAGAVLLLWLGGCGPSGPGPDRLFVSDEKAGVHVLDGRSGAREGELKTGERPRGLALSPDGRVLLVAASNANRIELWDTHSLQHLRDIGPVSDPERIALSPDGRRLYAASEDSSSALAFDVASGRTLRTTSVGPEPEGVAASPAGDLIAVTSEVAGVVHLIGPDGAIRKNLVVDSRPRDVLFRKGGRELWASSEQRGSIRVFALPGGDLLDMIDLAAAVPERDTVQAVELKPSRDGRTIYAALGRGDGVAEIDAASHKLRRWFPTGHRTWGIALSPDNKRLYAAAGLSGDLTEIDLGSGKTLRTVTLGGRPWTVVAVTR